MKTSGNTILITGGGSGIGLAMAKAFLAAGNKVIICGRRAAVLKKASEDNPGLITRVCDLVREDECLKLRDWLQQDCPQVNILVNNAGIQRDIDFRQGLQDLLHGESELAVNLAAPIFLSAALVPLLKDKEGAAILNVSSGLGFVPAAKMPIYSATKAGLHAFSMALRHQSLWPYSQPPYSPRSCTRGLS